MVNESQLEELQMKPPCVYFYVHVIFMRNRELNLEPKPKLLRRILSLFFGHCRCYCCGGGSGSGKTVAAANPKATVWRYQLQSYFTVAVHTTYRTRRRNFSNEWVWKNTILRSGDAILWTCDKYLILQANREKFATWSHPPAVAAAAAAIYCCRNARAAAA